MEWKIPIREDDAINLVGQEGEIEIELIASVRRVGDIIYLEGTHFTKNAGRALGLRKLEEFGRDFLRQHGSGATRLIVAGAKRTSGASPGVAPPPIIIDLE